MPDIAPLDIMKEVGKIWQNVKESDMKRYKQMAKADTVRYQEELEVFINMLNELRQTKKKSAYSTPSKANELV